MKIPIKHIAYHYKGANCTAYEVEPFLERGSRFGFLKTLSINLKAEKKAILVLLLLDYGDLDVQ